eukprot:Nitzschia sp. Nitz4//scaffold75_size92586//53602//55203//NITZ4_004858-RA/size92586-augustus-gene-0.81-mRNA-1//1//CDS//3329557714//9187//frame0
MALWKQLRCTNRLSKLESIGSKSTNTSPSEEMAKPVHTATREKRNSKSLPLHRHVKANNLHECEGDSEMSSSHRTCVSFEDSLNASYSTNGPLDPSNQGRYNRCSSFKSSDSNATPKSVSFSIVEIRDYERTISDNPSCSSGPPVGIGWGYVESQVVHINHYESSQRRRRGYFGMTLTRLERERILDEWGVSRADVVSGIRNVLRVKNQRRTTVRNHNKLKQFEQRIGFFSNKSRTSVEDQECSLEEPHLDGDHEDSESDEECEHESVSHEEDELDLSRGKCSPMKSAEIIESDEEVLDSMEVKVVPTKYYQPSTSSWTPLKCQNSPLGDADDAASIGSAESTPSTREIDRFHRELELEMFGATYDSPVGVTDIMPTQVECRCDNVTKPSGRYMSPKADNRVVPSSPPESFSIPLADSRNPNQSIDSLLYHGGQQGSVSPRLYLEPQTHGFIPSPSFAGQPSPKASRWGSAISYSNRSANRDVGSLQHYMMPMAPSLVPPEPSMS